MTAPGSAGQKSGPSPETLFGIQSQQAAFSSLPPEYQQMINNHPMVRDHGMHAPMAYDWMTRSIPKKDLQKDFFGNLRRIATS